MISSGEASFDEITQIYQSRIDEINPTINAYITDTISSALDSETNQSNDNMPLAGIPYCLLYTSPSPRDRG